MDVSDIDIGGYFQVIFEYFPKYENIGNTIAGLPIEAHSIEKF